MLDRRVALENSRRECFVAIEIAADDRETFQCAMSQLPTIGDEHRKEALGNLRQAFVLVLTVFEQRGGDNGEHFELNAIVVILKVLIDQFIENELRLHEILQQENEADA